MFRLKTVGWSETHPSKLFQSIKVCDGFASLNPSSYKLFSKSDVKYCEIFLDGGKRCLGENLQ